LRKKALPGSKRGVVLHVKKKANDRGRKERKKTSLVGTKLFDKRRDERLLKKERKGTNSGRGTKRRGPKGKLT